MPATVVVDTNVWVSAFINRHRYPARLKNAWLNDRFVVVVSVALLDELADVLSRTRLCGKYGLSGEETSEFLRLLAARAVKVITSGQVRACRDVDDNMVLETAIQGRARYVVSRDDDIKRDQQLVAQLEARGISVLSVQQFVDTLESGEL